MLGNRHPRHFFAAAGNGPIPTTSGGWILALNVAVLIVAAMIVFANNAPLTFVGYDGKYNFLKIGLQMKWMPIGMSFGNNPLQEIGNIFMAHNIWLLPGYVLGGLISDMAIAVPVIYTTNAVIGFLCLCALGRLLNLQPLIGLTAAWVLVLLAMPFFWPIPLYPITGMVPHYLQIISLVALMTGCFFAIGRTSRTISLFSSVALFVMAYFSAAAAPAPFILGGPVLLIFGTAFLIIAERQERKIKIVALVGLMAAATPGLLPFLAGTLLNSVPFFFKQELITFQGGWDNVGMVFSGLTWRGGPSFFAFSMAGCVFATVWGGRTLRATAIATLFGVALLIGAGALFNTVMKPLVGLRDLEIFLWPFYALFTGVLLAFLWQLLASVDGPVWRWGGRVLPLVPAIFAVVLSFPDEGKKNWARWPFPPKDNGLVHTLHEKISLSANPRYRGMVATFTGVHGVAEPIIWPRLFSYDHQLHYKSGNDYRAQGLWYFDIPTLFGYNQLMTPQFYLMASRLLARPVDRQMRNVILLTRVNANYLRSIGVHFVITDNPLQPTPAGMALRQQTTVPDTATLYLYELSTPNLGTYSPTEAVLLRTAKETIDAFRDTNFDFRRRVAVTRPITDTLTPATVESVEIIRQGMRIKASSPGTSLLLLPLQFSRCLDLSANAHGPTGRLVRANVMQTGLLFTDRVDTTVSFSYGPHRNAWCRIRDNRGFAAMTPAAAR